MYSITLHTNAIIRPRDSGIYGRWFLLSSQYWNRKQRIWNKYV